MTDAEGTEQLALVPSAVPRKRSSRAKPAPEPASSLPVARVVVDTGLAHLDRFFDYLVPTTLDDQAVVGCRVKVRFAGQLVDGFVVERIAHSEHEGSLAFLAKVVSSEPVLTPEVLRLARAIADRWAGTLGDVLRLAIPPRHARAEAHPVRAPASAPEAAGSYGWHAYVHGRAFVESLERGERPRVVWNAVPGVEPSPQSIRYSNTASGALPERSHM